MQDFRQQDRRGEVRADGSMTLADHLHEIADRLARLVPCHRDPHRFHEDKSELVDALRRLAANDNNPTADEERRAHRNTP